MKIKLVTVGKLKEKYLIQGINEYLNGKQLSSEEFSKEIEQLGISGKSNLTFVIGGSLGLSDSVLQRSNQQISFGRLTYPHQLMRLVLVEQIYRGFRIMKGEPYHK